MRIPPIKDNPELTVQLKRAVAAYEAMTPAQKSNHHRAQRRSWAIGNMMLDHPEMTREQVEAIYDEIDL